MKKLLVIQVAGLGHAFALRNGVETLAGMTLQSMQSGFPAVTCTAQATLRTGLSVAGHGMVANGFFDEAFCKPRFWEQSAKLVSGSRIWDDFRARGGTVGLFFIQQSLGESVDCVLSPAPIHTHGGGLIMGCYAQPPMLEGAFQRAAGRPFKLHHYWGPLASVKASTWIADALAGFLGDAHAPDLIFSYLPGLDYDLQRFGPDHPKSRRALQVTQRDLEKLVAAAQKQGYDVVVFGDYAITPVTRAPVYLNRALRDAGFMQVRMLKGMAYPDFYASRAFAVVDHQVALIHCPDPAAHEAVRSCLQALPGVAEVWAATERAAHQVDHPRGGDLMAVAEAGTWFAYPWWHGNAEAPDYACHVDIHNKPGFDPCELFFGRNPFHVSMDAARIKGTHGRTETTAFASTLALAPHDLTALAQALKNWLS